MNRVDHMASTANEEYEEILWAKRLNQLRKETKRAMIICKSYRYDIEYFKLLTENGSLRMKCFLWKYRYYCGKSSEILKGRLKMK